MLVGSCLQCRGASAIWFVNHWWHLTSSTIIYVWPCCMPGLLRTSTWCSASDSGWRQKANCQLEKTAGSPSQRLAQQGSGGWQRSTAIYSVKIWGRQGSRSGATVDSVYKTTTMTTTTMMMMMKKKKDVSLASKWRVNLIFRGTYRLSGTVNVECLKIIDVGCNLKQFDLEAKRKCIFHFRP